MVHQSYDVFRHLLAILLGIDWLVALSVPPKFHGDDAEVSIEIRDDFGFEEWVLDPHLFGAAEREAVQQDDWFPFATDEITNLHTVRIEEGFVGQSPIGCQSEECDRG